MAKKGPGGWRAKPIFGFALDVMCGGCEKWVREVAADSAAEATNGEGRCRECLLKEPVIVEVEPEPAVLVEAEPEEKPVPPWERPTPVRRDSGRHR